MLHVGGGTGGKGHDCVASRPFHRPRPRQRFPDRARVTGAGVATVVGRPVYVGTADRPGRGGAAGCQTWVPVPSTARQDQVKPAPALRMNAKSPHGQQAPVQQFGEPCDGVARPHMTRLTAPVAQRCGCRTGQDGRPALPQQSSAEARQHHGAQTAVVRGQTGVLQSLGHHPLDGGGVGVVEGLDAVGPEVDALGTSHVDRGRVMDRCR